MLIYSLFICWCEKMSCWRKKNRCSSSWATNISSSRPWAPWPSNSLWEAEIPESSTSSGNEISDFVSSSPFFFSVFFHVIPFFLCLYSINKTVRKPKKTMIHKSSLEGTCVQIVNKEIFLWHLPHFFWHLEVSPGLTEWYPTFLVRFAKMPEAMSGSNFERRSSESSKSEKVEKQNTKQFFFKEWNWWNVPEWIRCELIELIWINLCLYPGGFLYFGLHGLHGLAENGKTHGFCDKVCAAMPGFLPRGVPWEEFFVKWW